MSSAILALGNGFWNIRGSFRVGGVVDIGTHVSLVRKSDGRFVFLDSYSLPVEIEREVRELTNDGEDVDAIVNLHPFHTVHVRAMHDSFPRARLYGTTRHLSRFPDLPWQRPRTEEGELHRMFAGDLEFSVPRGVDFISANEDVHFSSVLVYHRASKTIHVDDSLMFIRLPRLVRRFGLTFHPTLVKALHKRAGAAQEFRSWAVQVTEAWCDAENLCAAHAATLTARDNQGPSIHVRMRSALEQVDPMLRSHQRQYG